MKRKGIILLIVMALAMLCTCTFAAPPEKHRIVVMTDIGGDPDDIQSMVRFMLYTCDFDVEGFCTGFGHGHYKNTRPELIRNCIDAYAKVLPNLRKHRGDYPSAKELAALVKDGHNGDPHKVGPGMDSEASEWIIKVLDRDDARPVWFSIWGGPRELAQAIWKVSQTRSANELAAFKKKIRVHSIADQDRTAEWVKKNHPDVFWIFSNRLFRGIWNEGDQEIVSAAWLEKNVRTGHGPLGPEYPAKAAGKVGVKEGDTPSYFYVLPNGLSDPEQPEWGNWGGRFHRSGRGNEYLPAADYMNGRKDLLYTIHRWRTAYQNEFEARMDWCIKSYDQANHKPAAVLNGDKTLRVFEIACDGGQKVKLSAANSSDPDNDRLTYKWWVYQEAGTYWDTAPVENTDSVNAVVTVPEKASGRTIHVILEVTDTGDPPLTAYRRAILKVSGKPHQIPAGKVPDELYMTTPITKLSGPSEGGWTFYRAVNINGPALTIDGNKWSAEADADFICENRPLNSPDVELRPPTDPARAKMIHCFRWDREPEITITRLPQGKYAVYAYLWEETSPETFDIRVNGELVARDFNSGPKGCWRRLGPWNASPRGGKITITASGGAANFSGIEIYKQK